MNPGLRAVLTLAVLTVVVGSLAAGRFPRAELTVPPSDIIFAHGNHTDLDCADCHTDIAASGSEHDRNFPSMEICGGCHDVEDFDQCGVCHRNTDDPQAIPHPDRTIHFSHESHLSRSVDCRTCHGPVEMSDRSSEEYMPSMATCLACHDGLQADASCTLCHGDNITLQEIHPADWRHQHRDNAGVDREWCMQCHRRSSSCLDCHRGDNLYSSIHDLNYRFTHGLDAQSKRFDCTACHDRQSFCNDCHERESLFPLLHSTATWRTDHGRAARRDIENCASCHDSADPTCARAGCHRDNDGFRGTDPRFHSAANMILQARGPWHHDDGYYCYRCHTNTRTAGQGFCGYCHGDVD